MRLTCVNVSLLEIDNFTSQSNSHYQLLQYFEKTKNGARNKNRNHEITTTSSEIMGLMGVAGKK